MKQISNRFFTSKGKQNSKEQILTSNGQYEVDDDVDESSANQAFNLQVQKSRKSEKDTDFTNEWGDNMINYLWDGPENSDKEVADLV